MITLTIMRFVALRCVLVGCLTGLLTLVGVLASLFVGVLVGALAGYLAGRFMGTETSLGRNILMGVLGSFVGEFLFGLLGIHASGSFSSGMFFSFCSLLVYPPNLFVFLYFSARARRSSSASSVRPVITAM